MRSETVKNKNKETNKLKTAVQISRLNVIVVNPRRTGGKLLRSDHVIQNALAVRNNEALELGNSGCKLMTF